MANTSAFQAEDAGSIPVVPSVDGRPTGLVGRLYAFPVNAFVYNVSGLFVTLGP